MECNVCVETGGCQLVGFMAVFDGMDSDGGLRMRERERNRLTTFD